MVRALKFTVRWSEPALADLDAIADYIALDNAPAARKLVRAVFRGTDRLTLFPNSGRVPPECPGSPYREVIVPPCRILYRQDGNTVHIVLVTRGEQPLEPHRLLFR